MTFLVLQLTVFLNLEVVVSTFGGAFYIWFGVEGFTCQAVIVTFSD